MRTPRVFALTDHALAAMTLPAAPPQPNYVPAGQTERFFFFYQHSLEAVGQAIANTLTRPCEGDYQRLASLFAVEPHELPFHVYVVPDVSGAMHYGCDDTEVYIGVSSKLPPESDTYSLLLAAEVVEVFEAAIQKGWNCAFSHGEGLSRVVAAVLHPGSETSDLTTAPVWLDKAQPVAGKRFNWVDDTDPLDTNPFSVGCAVLFLNWLHFKLGAPWDAIAKSGGKYLADTYQILFGDRTGWARFKSDIDARFPPEKPSGLTSDNPFA